MLSKAKQKKTSLIEFAALLQGQLGDIAKRESLNLDNAENRGYAFALWAVQLLMDRDAGLEESPEEVVLRGGSDLGVDAVLTDDGNRALILVQAKNQGTGRKPKSLSPEHLKAFLGLHTRLMSADFIESGSQAARELLGSYADRVADGWKVRFYFMTTGSASAPSKQLVVDENSELETSRHDIAYELYDRARLRDTYIEIESLEASIPEETHLDLPDGLFVEKSDPFPCVVAIVKGNTLVDLYNRQGYKEALFAWNIRNYLGDRGINRDIKKTAQDKPGRFFYFNNGITAVCEGYTREQNHLVVKKFQIINGAQTVASLAKARRQPEVEVLFRLIKTGRVDTEAGINREIIQANNTQNAIRLSDFRANDPIQNHLRRAISEFPASETLSKITYQPKRTSKRGGPRKVKLEELAKIRYAYLYDPLLVHSSPKSLWTPRSEAGSYEKAFGVNGELEDVWSKSTLEQTLLAVALHDAAEVAAKEERQRDSKQDYFKRLRFHTLSLARRYVECGECPSVHSLLGSKEKFQQTWDKIWRCARRLLHMNYMSRVRDPENPMTRFSFVRSEKIWDGLLEAFRFDLKI